jgi:excisionase family DNA binding protein
MNLPKTSHRDPRLWTTTELARFLGCTERHIYQLRERGLPTIRLGTLVRFNPAEALSWLQRQGKTSKLPSESGDHAPASDATAAYLEKRSPKVAAEMFGIPAEEERL